MIRTIIDVREPTEFSISHVKGAVNIPISKIISDASILADIPKDAEVILYCNSGSRSNAAGSMMRSLVFLNINCYINQSHVESELDR